MIRACFRRWLSLGAVLAAAVLAEPALARAQATFPMSIQKVEALKPQAEIKFDKGVFTRSTPKNDPGTRLQWHVKKDGKTLSEVNARATGELALPERQPGTYEVALELYFPVYRPTSSERKGQFRVISNTIKYKIDAAGGEPVVLPPDPKPEDSKKVAEPKKEEKKG